MSPPASLPQPSDSPANTRSPRLRYRWTRFLLSVSVILVVAANASSSDENTLAGKSTAASSPASTAPSDTRVVFLGDSGFLIVAGGKKVLIDALTGPSQMSKASREALSNAQPPFDNIDLVLATHTHSDHFHAPAVREFLEKNPKAVFVSTSRATRQLANFGARVISADPTIDAPAILECAGINIKAIYLSDVADEVMNNGYVVTVNGLKFFHSGDVVDFSLMQAYNLADDRIDLAFVQNFFLQGPKWRDEVKGMGQYLFPIHYRFTTPRFDAQRIRAAYPGAIIFDQILDSWTLPPPGGMNPQPPATNR